MTRAAFIEWAVAMDTLKGFEQSGDHYVVAEVPEGVLVAVIDGVGHGSEACVVAETAIDVLKTSPQSDLRQLVMKCHDALRITRGVVMSLAWFYAFKPRMCWLGVGNVEGVLLRSVQMPSREPKFIRRHLMTWSGLVGARLPALQAVETDVLPGDMLVFATDGIDSEFSHALETVGEPQAIVDRILAKHGRRDDDALVLAARYLERPT
jgi:phosphoserine phosphatase RsbX